MTIKRGEVWLANLDLTRGSEQAGTRPVLVFQNDLINRFTTTILTIPFTTNLPWMYSLRLRADYRYDLSVSDYSSQSSYQLAQQIIAKVEEHLK